VKEAQSMQISLAERSALVTGAGRGIGRAIALALAGAGADVAVNFRRDEAAANETVEAIRALGGKGAAYQASVENWDEDQAMVAEVLAEFGPISILVNNAGIASRGQSVADTDPAEMERVVRVHAFAPHYLCKLLVPQMRGLGRADIVMISSVGTLHWGPRGAPYSMGKAAMEALAYTLAKEEREHGIRTNIVAPSLTVTEMGKRLTRATTGLEDIHALDARSPFGRVSTPEDVAAAVLWMVSPANPYANGQKININGGG
jgi:NAD(P)-dependent dehydrogenase (short-subunit alcohol dehydrogenase family)